MSGMKNRYEAVYALVILFIIHFRGKIRQKRQVNINFSLAAERYPRRDNIIHTVHREKIFTDVTRDVKQSRG